MLVPSLRRFAVVALLAVGVACSSGPDPVAGTGIELPRPAPPLAEVPILDGVGDDEGTLPAIEDDDDVEPAADDGPVLALSTPTGVVVAVRGGEPGAWVVGTPCFAEAVLGSGEPVVAPRVLIDPGHGGDDEPGAVGANGLEEADLNLDVAEQVVELLEARGVSAALTRTGDYRMAIVARAELAVALQPEAFVSIHHNAGPAATSPEPGTEVFHQLGSAESERLGGLVFDELTRALAPLADVWAASEFRGVLARSNRDGDDLYGVLRRTEGVVAVLTEALYLGDPDDAALLADPDVVRLEAEAIARGVIRFLDTDDEAGLHVDDHRFTGVLGGGGGTDGCVDPPLA